MPGPRDSRAGVHRDRRDAVWSRLVLRTYGDVCHICGHGGARQADHLVDPGTDPEIRYKVSNGRPAHGSARGRGNNPCPVCSQLAGAPVYCNQIRAHGTVERARRIIRERTGHGLAETPKDSGREW